MKTVLISDTHSQHQKLELPKGDMLIHAGDVSKRGTVAEVHNFLEWFARQDFKYKIFVAGNHDFFFENASSEEIEKAIPENVIYLNDSGVEIEGIKIWGSPIQPWFFDWAFNRQRGEAIAKHWALIPNDTDVLITHGPPFGILDKTARNINAGCEELMLKIDQLPNLKLHVFGHIHEAYGIQQKNNTQFVNASVLNLGYQLVNEAVVVEV